MNTTQSYTLLNGQVIDVNPREDLAVIRVMERELVSALDTASEQESKYRESRTDSVIREETVCVALGFISAPFASRASLNKDAAYSTFVASLPRTVSTRSRARSQVVREIKRYVEERDALAGCQLHAAGVLMGLARDALLGGTPTVTVRPVVAPDATVIPINGDASPQVSATTTPGPVGDVIPIVSVWQGAESALSELASLVEVCIADAGTDAEGTVKLAVLRASVQHVADRIGAAMELTVPTVAEPEDNREAPAYVAPEAPVVEVPKTQPNRKERRKLAATGS